MSSSSSEDNRHCCREEECLNHILDEMKDDIISLKVDVENHHPTVDDVADQIEEILQQYVYGEFKPMDTIADLEQESRLERIEKQIDELEARPTVVQVANQIRDTLLEDFEKSKPSSTIADLEKESRLKNIEQRLTDLETSISKNFEQISDIVVDIVGSTMDKVLNKYERKLFDKMDAVFEKQGVKRDRLIVIDDDDKKKKKARKE